MNPLSLWDVSDFWDTGFCLRLTLTLGHFLWQGSVVALLVTLAGRCLRRSTANLRYSVHVAAMLLMVGCVPVTYWLVGITVSAEQESHSQRVNSVDSPRTASESLVPSETSFAPQPISDASSTLVETSRIAGVNAATEVSASVAGPPEAATVFETYLRPAAPHATAVYLFGVVVMFCRLTLSLWGGQRLRRAATPVEDKSLLAMVQRQAEQIGLATAPVVAYCRRVSVPVVVGVVKPIILLPASLATRLAPDQLQAVLTHELAHLRRYDLWVNLLQRLVEAALFFHPAVWYVSRRMDIERENCCDDMVVSAVWRRVEYADALLRMAELCAAIPGARASSQATVLAASGTSSSQFKRRVLRVLGVNDRPKFSLTRGGTALLWLTLSAVLLTPYLAHGLSQSSDGNAVDATETRDDDSLSPQSTSLADAVRTFNAKYADDPIGKHQPPLTADEVVAAICWHSRDREDLPVTEEEFLAFRQIYETERLPEGWRLQAATTVRPDERSEFEEWTVQLRVPRKEGKEAYEFLIREQMIRSHPVGGNQSVAETSKTQDDGATRKTLGGPVGWIISQLDAGQRFTVGGLSLAIGDTSKVDSVETVIKANPGQTCRVRYTLDNYADANSGELVTGELTFSVDSPKDPLASTIRLRAVEEDTGQPVSSARFVVQLGKERTAYEADERAEFLATAPTRTPRYCVLECRADGYAPMRAFWRNGPNGAKDELPESFTFPMAQCATVGGTMTDEDGKPVVGAIVLFSASDHTSHPGRRAVQSFHDEKYTTDKEGRWVCDIAPPTMSSASIRVNHPDFAVDTSTYSVSDQIDELKRRGFTWVLKRGFAIRGRVLGLDGRPVDGVTLALSQANYCSQDGPFAKTNAAGEYRFERVTPRADVSDDVVEFAVTAVKPGLAPAMKLVPGYFGRPLGTSTLQERAVDFVLERGRTLRIRVVDREGQPQKGAWIIADEWRGTNAMAALTVARRSGLPLEADEDGVWEWTWAPADPIGYDILKGGFAEIRNHTLTAKGDTTEVTVTLARPQILTGRVIDAATKQPIDSFLVQKGFITGGGTPDGASWVTVPETRGRNGQYRLTIAMPPNAGSYKYRALADGYKPAVSQSVPFAEGDVSLDFELNRAAVGTSPVSAGKTESRAGGRERTGLR